jgi:tRNA pseudouridine13 synthase
VGGRIKVRPEDFLVEEQPLYEPSGSGEHIYLGVEKTRVSHGELVSCLARHFGVREGCIGFAGMKDKQGITRQVISVHLHADPVQVQPPHERIRVLWASRHGNKLRRGHLAGNRFSIRIRDVDATVAPRVQALVRRLESTGVPCYFGPQRFGYRRNNHLIGAALLLGDGRAAVDELLGTGGSPFPEYQRERRELYDQGRFDQAAHLWTAADRAERVAVGALRAGLGHEEAARRMARLSFALWVSGFQSAVFNRVLDERIASGRLGVLVEGDLAARHDNGAIFAVGEAELREGALPERLRRFEISPSGPMWGTRMMRPGRAVEQVERAALEATGIGLERFLASPLAPSGERRPLRSRLAHPEVDAGVDEHGHYVRVAFDLPAGMYATVVLREIMKDEQVEGGEGDGEAPA